MCTRDDKDGIDERDRIMTALWLEIFSGSWRVLLGSKRTFWTMANNACRTRLTASSVWYNTSSIDRQFTPGKERGTYVRVVNRIFLLIVSAFVLFVLFVPSTALLSLMMMLFAGSKMTSPESLLNTNLTSRGPANYHFKKEH